MSNTIILSNEERRTDSTVEMLFNIPLGFLDPNHLGIDESLQKKILHDRYHKKLIEDGLETGHFFFDNNKVLRFQTKQPMHSISGFIFEAFIVYQFNENIRTIGKRAFTWCTNRTQCKDDYIDQFKVIGTGFISTKNIYPQFYSPQNNFDIQFIRTNKKHDLEEQATIQGTTTPTGIQIKAITGNEMVEIITPIMSGKYSHVLTLLRHSDGVHSYNKCMDIIYKLYKEKKIELSEKDRIESRIQHPETLGINQQNVDDYYQYIKYWFNGQAQPDQFVSDGIGLEVKGYKFGNGILLPES